MESREFKNDDANRSLSRSVSDYLTIPFIGIYCYALNDVNATARNLFPNAGTFQWKFTRYSDIASSENVISHYFIPFVFIWYLTNHGFYRIYAAFHTYFIAIIKCFSNVRKNGFYLRCSSNIQNMSYLVNFSSFLHTENSTDVNKF